MATTDLQPGYGPYPVTVMTERTELTPGVGWKDCVYSSGMMLHAHARGKFPFGWTPEEREALERSDDQPNETGADMADLTTAMARRYGWSGHAVVGTLDAALRTTDGRGFVLLGTNGRLPAGHTLRRWQPGFTGGHAWFVRPNGNGTTVRVLDPLAPQGYAGDNATVETVLKWAWGVSSARWAHARELEGNMAFYIYDPVADSRRKGKVVKGTVFYADYLRQVRLGSMSGDATVQVFGHRGTSYAVQVTTGTIRADGVAVPSMVFIEKAKVTGITDAPPPLTYEQGLVDGKAQGTSEATEADKEAAKKTGIAEERARWIAYRDGLGPPEA